MLTSNSITRRAWLLVPAGLAGLANWWLTRDRPIPNPSVNGSGEVVVIVLFSNIGTRLQTIRVRKVTQTTEQWRRQLDPEAFSVTRRQATEFAFHNLYWDNHKRGVYRCICCGSAVFFSDDKYDSSTGWPSFTAPIAAENVTTKLDDALGLRRTEVECKKCDAHLGHLFNDGPPPTYQRYCLNSAALRFFAA